MSRVKALVILLIALFVLWLLDMPWLSFALLAPPEKIKLSFPHVASIWLFLRPVITPFVCLVSIVSFLYLIFPFIKSATHFAKSKKREVLLSVIAFIVALVLAELVLRLAGYIPGQINTVSSFQPVDKLTLYESFVADEHGITYIQPSIADKLHAFLNRSFTSKFDVYLHWFTLQYETPNLDPDFHTLAKDYALVSSLKEKSTFTNFYRSILSKDKKDSFDSLIINYVHSPVNSDGFRSVAFRKKSSRKRILLIGDSFTFGNTTTNKTHSFYDLLLAHGFEVYNTGLCDADPAQYEAVARKYIPLLKPDIVIVNFFIGNDIQYYRQNFAPYQTYTYSTNAGYLHACPLGVSMANKEEAYNYALETCRIPVGNSKFNSLCSKTVISTFLWNLLKDKFHFSTESKLLNRFYAKAKAKELVYPDANNRIQDIKQLCDSNRSAFVLSIIPVISSDGKRNLTYVNADRKLFPWGGGGIMSRAL